MKYSITFKALLIHLHFITFTFISSTGLSPRHTFKALLFRLLLTRLSKVSPVGFDTLQHRWHESVESAEPLILSDGYCYFLYHNYILSQLPMNITNQIESMNAQTNERETMQEEMNGTTMFDPTKKKSSKMKVLAIVLACVLALGVVISACSDLVFGDNPSEVRISGCYEWKVGTESAIAYIFDKDGSFQIKGYDEDGEFSFAGTYTIGEGVIELLFDDGSSGSYSFEVRSSSVLINGNEYKKVTAPSVKPNDGLEGNETEEPGTTTPPPVVPVIKTYRSGMYKVGTDLPAGEYVIITSSLTYMEILRDSSGTFESIIANDNFTSRTIVTLEEGQYFNFTKGTMYAIEDAPALNLGSVLPEGMYLVGVDIPAGEYKVRTTGIIGGYFEICRDSTHSFYSIIANDFFEGEKYITVQEGQYLQLSSAELILK